MTGEKSWFLAVVIVNCVVSVGYLVWYLIFKRDQDNRKQYMMHTVIMALCPVVGPLYFLCGFLKYHFIKFGNRDLSDVEFSKQRQAARMKADEERERNIVPVEEAIIISDQEKKRTNMLNILLGETGESLSAIALALDSDDSEVAHYAASFLQSKLDAFRDHVRQSQRTIQERKAEAEPCQEEILQLIHDMNHILKQKVLTRVEQMDYVGQMEALCQDLYENNRDWMEASCYSNLFSLLLELKAYDKAESWGERFADQYPDQLQPYTLRMKLYFETEQTDKFIEVLAKLRTSNIEIDYQTLELIRMIQL